MGDKINNKNIIYLYMVNSIDYKNKYLKYKHKYLKLKGGSYGNFSNLYYRNC